jgi:hypothetical protein
MVVLMAAGQGRGRGVNCRVQSVTGQPMVRSLTSYIVWPSSPIDLVEGILTHRCPQKIRKSYLQLIGILKKMQIVARYIENSFSIKF